MAGDTKQQTTYKKRVISESDDDGSSSGAEDVPLSRGAAVVPNTTGSSTGPAAVTTAAEQEGHHNPQDIAAGSALLKEASGIPANGEKPPIADAESRHEVAAGGFPTDVAAASAVHGAEPNGHSIENGNGKMDMDESSEDEKPLASKAQQKATTANGDKKPASKPKPRTQSKTNGNESSSSDDGRPLNIPDRQPRKPISKRKSSSSEKAKDTQRVKTEDSSDDDVPLAAQVNGGSNKIKDRNGMDVDESSDDDTPLAAQTKHAKKAKTDKAAKAGKEKKKEKKRAKDDDDVSEASETDAKPKKKKQKVKSETPATSAPIRKSKVKKEESASPLKKGKGKAKAEEMSGGSQGGEDEEEDENYKWWVAKQEEGDGGEDGAKWTTLQHSGVLFPPEYEPLPANVKLKYDGKPLDLPPQSEEVAGFFAALVETDHAKDEKFRENFFKDFLKVLAEFPPRNKVTIDPVNGLDRLDFGDMWQYFEVEKEKKKAMTKDEKKRAKEEKDELEKPFKTCLVDGREEIVGNFRLEPPGLFRGRGKHPKKGRLKKRLRADQITINIGKDAEIPKAPAGQNWKEVVHKNNVTWLANWQENVNGNFKYVFLAAGSSWKGQSDMAKYEKARELKKIIGRIRLDYERDLASKVMADRQRATAVYFIDRFALRVGNEKGEEEADTVGCCSLRYEHVTLAEPNLVTFDFLGKDSIRFYQPDREVDVQVFKNLKLFKKDGKEGEDIFDRVKPDILNKYFGSYMPGLSAKVFRTYNASFLLQEQLKNTPKDASVADKLLHYNRANRLVAEMCNHQRAASKTHGAVMEKLGDKLKGLKYNRMKLRYTLWAIDKDNKKKHKQYRDLESDLDDEWMEQHEEDLVEKEKVKIKKKWEKDNEKRKADGTKELTEKELEDLLEGADEYGAEIKEERRIQRVEPKKSQTTAKVLEALVKVDEKIDAQKLQALDREEGKEISLTTARINYMDPRVTVVWCKKYDVPIEKIFSKTLRTKFVWAMEVEDDWEF